MLSDLLYIFVSLSTITPRPVKGQGNLRFISFYAIGNCFSRKKEDALTKTALDSSAVFTEPPVTLSVMTAVRTRVAMTARPVWMNFGREFFSFAFIEVPHGTDWYSILEKIALYV